MNLLLNKQLKFVLKLILLYSILYFTLKFLTGIASPGGMYSTMVSKYFNIALYTRNAIIFCVSKLVNVFGYQTYRESNYVLRIVNGTGIKLVYGCLAYGVMSFWMAYVIASSTILKTKIKWVLIGLFVLWIVNIIRIALVLISTVHNWSFPFEIDQHTWFNIIAYGLIFIMIYFYEKSIKIINE